MTDRFILATVIFLFIIIIHLINEASLVIHNAIKIFGMPNIFNEGSAIWYLDPKKNGVEKLVIIKDGGIYITFPINLFADCKNITVDRMAWYRKLSMIEDAGFYAYSEISDKMTVKGSSLSEALEKISIIIDSPDIKNSTISKGLKFLVEYYNKYCLVRS
jgi:hypothetical protein